ncbi:MAG: hypothetical protein M3N18_07415 [Actinomycetota bacterium]|nr:hypothetical protein [Actinomycetota bacterium]
MGYKGWTRNSRRDRRRRKRGSRRRTSQGADKTFLVIAGLFVLATVLIIAALGLFAW